MPTGLIILIGILLFVVALLSINIGVIVDYKEEHFIYVKALFIKIKIYPKKKKKKKKRKKNKQSKKEEQKNDAKTPQSSSKPKKKKSALSVPSILWKMRETVLILIKKLFGYLHFKFIRLNIVVSAEDAAKTALLYGASAQGISYLLEILDNISNVEIEKHSRISLTSDFINQSPYFDGEIFLYIRIINLIKVLFLALKAYIKALINKKKS